MLAAPDKLRGTATASDVADAVARAARSQGWSCAEVPMADGGEGMLDAIGGARRHTVVHGPLGELVEAEWRLLDDTAVIETERACGLSLVGGPELNDPVDASTLGAGELIEAAMAGGARHVLVGVGGSATTDGGWGAVRKLGGGARLHGVDVLVACDVTTTFLDAARVFGPQKGASDAQVRLLEARLARLAQIYEDRFGVDVRGIPGSGAAGGLAGGLAALGASLTPGFDLVASETGLEEHLAGADLVVTAEGRLDSQSFSGKVVGGVLEMAAEAGVPALVVAGEAAPDAVPSGNVQVVSLSELHGAEASFAHPLRLIEHEVAVALEKMPSRG